MKKSLIIDPGFRLLREGKASIGNSYFPRGAMSVATFLRANEIKTDFIFIDSLNLTDNFIHNVNLIFKTLEDMLAGKDYSFIAIGGPFTMQFPVIGMLAEMVRQISPQSHISLGGFHASFLDEESLQEVNAADSIIRGEAEWTALELCHFLAEKSPLENINGLTFRCKESIIRNPGRSPGRLEDLPIIDYGLIPDDLYRDIMINLTASRGCAFKCTFCAEQRFWGNKVRMFPIELMIEEIRRVSRVTEMPIFSIEDSMFSIQSPYFLRFCEALKDLKERNFFINHINSRIDTVNPEGLKLLKQAGISRISFGIESLSEKVLKLMNKGLKREQVVNACKLVRDNGIAVATLWIFGHPGDDQEQCLSNIEALEEFYMNDLHQVAVLSLFIPYPGTPFFSNPDEYGLKIFKKNWDLWDRYSFDRVCELNDYPNSILLNDYKKAWEVKQNHERSSVLRFYINNKIIKSGNLNLIIAPTYLENDGTDQAQLSESWKELSSIYPEGLIGILFSDDEIQVRVHPESSRFEAILANVAGKIRDNLGGNEISGNYRIRIKGSRQNTMNHFALSDMLTKTTLEIIESF